MVLMGLAAVGCDPGERRDPGRVASGLRLTLRLAGTTATLCGALAGCMVGPDYVKPKVDTPEAYRFAEGDVQQTVDTEWWKQFGDPVLNQLIAEALANNMNVKIAAANVEQS